MNTPMPAEMGPQQSARKIAMRGFFERMARERHRWIERNAYFYDEDYRYMRFLISKGSAVLELGCGIGDMLKALKPSKGVGVDFSAAMIDEARKRHPDLHFQVGDVEDPVFMNSLDGTFDYIVMSDTIGALDDCEAALASLHHLCHRDTRLVISYYSHLWEPVLALGSWLCLRMQTPDQNFLSPLDIQNLLGLAEFEVVKREWRQLLPRRWLGIGPLVNRYIGTLPIIRNFSMRHYLVARSLRAAGTPTVAS